MVRSIVIHRVKDYDTWRSMYESVAPMQAAGGVVSQSVARSVEDPNDVLVIHDFETAEQAKAFFASPELHGAMEEAGVEGPPSVIWVGTVD